MSTQNSAKWIALLFVLHGTLSFADLASNVELYDPKVRSMTQFRGETFRKPDTRKRVQLYLRASQLVSTSDRNSACWRAFDCRELLIYREMLRFSKETALNEVYANCFDRDVKQRLSGRATLARHPSLDGISM